MPERKASKQMFTSLPFHIYKKAVYLNIKYNYTKPTGRWYSWITFSGRFALHGAIPQTVINRSYSSIYRETLADSQTTGQIS